MRVIRTRREDKIISIGSFTEIKEPVEGSYIAIQVFLKGGDKAIVRIKGYTNREQEFFLDSQSTYLEFFISPPQTLVYWPTLIIQLETPSDALLDSDFLVLITQGEAF